MFTVDLKTLEFELFGLNMVLSKAELICVLHLLRQWSSTESKDDARAWNPAAWDVCVHLECGSHANHPEKGQSRRAEPAVQLMRGK